MRLCTAPPHRLSTPHTSRVLIAYAAWLSVYGSGGQRELAADFVEYILERAEKAGDDVYEKAKEIVKEGKERGSLTLRNFEKEFEVDGEKYKVKVIDGEAVEEDRGGRKLLRIRITAEVDGARRNYMITYGRYGAGNAVRGVRRGEGRGRRQEARRRDRGADGREAEDIPHEERRYNNV
jgi:hypothetical protein